VDAPNAWIVIALMVLVLAVVTVVVFVWQRRTRR
jgi:hypothetical protein